MTNQYPCLDALLMSKQDTVTDVEDFTSEVAFFYQFDWYFGNRNNYDEFGWLSNYYRSYVVDQYPNTLPHCNTFFGTAA